MKRNRVTILISIAIFATLSYLLYWVKFPLPFFPSFLEIQFSNLPAIIGGYALGPVAGTAIVAIRTLLKLPGSTTAFVGETIDLIIGVSTVLASSLVYRKMHTIKGAVYGMGAGILAWVVVAVAANYFFVLDFYLEAYFGGNVDALLGILTVIPGINTANYMGRYIVYAILPFNLLISVLVYGITFLVYKRISHLIDELSKRLQK